VQQLFLTPHNSHSEIIVKTTTKTDMVLFWEIMVGMTIFTHMHMCKFSYTFVQVVLQIITHIDANLDFFRVFLIGTLLTAVVIAANRYVR
jgi:hypothetical protein